MTPEHFTEFIETVKMTTGMSENQIAKRIGVFGPTIRYWKKRGLTPRRAPMICARLRHLVREVGRVNISEKDIPLIEEALGFELHDNQINYLINKDNLIGGRMTGKTTAYCIRLALSEGPVIDLRVPERYSDGWTLENQRVYARSHFRHEFMKVREKLEKYGFAVREVRK